VRKIAAVAWKETLQIRRDRLSLGMLLGVPGLMVVLYGYALNFDVKNISLAVSDRCQCRASRELVAAFVNSGYFTLRRAEPSELNAEGLTRKREATAVLIIPEDFSRRLAAGREAELQLILDGANSNTATTALNYAAAIVGESQQALLLRAVRRAAGRLISPIDLQSRVWYNPELKSSHFLVPGLMGFILMITSVIATALSIVREKERGTMEQLRLAPLGLAELIAGKALPYLLLSLLAAATILSIARLLFGVSIRGSRLELAAATTLYLLGALGWGLFISTLANTQQQAFQLATLSSMLPAIILSGFVFPIRAMPELLQYLTYAVPARYYLEVLRGIVLKGSPLSLYPAQLLSLAAYTLVVLVLASLRLRRREA